MCVCVCVGERRRKHCYCRRRCPCSGAQERLRQDEIEGERGREKVEGRSEGVLSLQPPPIHVPINSLNHPREAAGRLNLRPTDIYSPLNATLNQTPVSRIDNL